MLADHRFGLPDIVDCGDRKCGRGGHEPIPGWGFLESGILGKAGYFVEACKGRKRLATHTDSMSKLVRKREFGFG